MEEKKRIGFLSQAYEVPHAEVVTIDQRTIPCASQSDIDDGSKGMTETEGPW